MDVDPMRLQLVGKRLFDVEKASISVWVARLQALEDLDNVNRVGDRAVEVGRERGHARLDGDPPDLGEPLEVPARVIPPELDLQADQAVGLDPVAEEHRVTVVGLGAGQLGRRDRVLAADEVPGREGLGPGEDQEIGGIAALEGNAGTFGRFEIVAQVGVHELRVVRLVGRQAEEVAIGVVEGQVEGRAGNERRQPGHRLGLGTPCGVGLVEQVGQDEPLEGVANLDRVPRVLEAGPALRRAGGRAASACRAGLRRRENSARPTGR